MKRQNIPAGGSLGGYALEPASIVPTADLAALESRAAELEAALRALVEAAIKEQCSMCRSGDAAYSDIVGAHVDQFANHACKTPLLRVSLRAALLLLAKGGTP